MIRLTAITTLLTLIALSLAVWAFDGGHAEPTADMPAEVQEAAPAADAPAEMQADEPTEAPAEPLSEQPAELADEPPST